MPRHIKIKILYFLKAQWCLSRATSPNNSMAVSGGIFGPYNRECLRILLYLAGIDQTGHLTSWTGSNNKELSTAEKLGTEALSTTRKCFLGLFAHFGVSQSSSFSPLSIGITGVHHHVWQKTH